MNKVHLSTLLLKLLKIKKQLGNPLSSILGCKSYIFDEQFNTSKIKPGFKRKIFFKKLPRILITKDTYRMGLGLMQKTSEKGIIRLVKVAAGVRQ